MHTGQALPLTPAQMLQCRLQQAFELLCVNKASRDSWGCVVNVVPTAAEADFLWRGTSSGLNQGRRF